MTFVTIKDFLRLFYLRSRGALSILVAMKTLLMALMLVLVGRNAMAHEPPSRAGEVRAVLDAQVEAWNRGDLETFMKGYWKSDGLTFFSGATRTAGYDGTVARYQKKYKEDGQVMGHLSFRELEVTPLGRDAAFVRGEWHLVRGKETMGGLFTLIFRKIAGAWKIVHDHTAAR